MYRGGEVGDVPGTVGAIDPEPELTAGDFSSWLRDLLGALAGTNDSDVPCDGCTACCTASQFVPIGPDETDTLAHIPDALLFPAPGLPAGHVLLGYDEHGHCPMLVDGACSIYDHRPLTCRTYDCRVFPATGVTLDDDKPLIAARAVRWRFTLPTAQDEVELEASRAAARYLEHHAELDPPTATQRAVLAVELHDLFIDDGSRPAPDPDPDVVRRRSAQRRS